MQQGRWGKGGTQRRASLILLASCQMLKLRHNAVVFKNWSFIQNWIPLVYKPVLLCFPPCCISYSFMRLLYVFGNLKVSFFPYSCSRGDFSHCASFIYFLLNCEKWSAWAQVLEPGSGLCFFTHILFNQKPSSLCSKFPFHYLTFMADVEGGSSTFKPATHTLPTHQILWN